MSHDLLAAAILLAQVLLLLGMGFSLVPWRPVIERRLGQHIAATVRGGGVFWVLGRERGSGIT